MRLFSMLLCAMFLFIISQVGFAQVLPDNPDVGKILTELFTDPKGLGSLGIAMSVIVLLVQVLKWSVIDRFFKEGSVARTIKLAAVFLLGQGYTVIFLVKAGTPALTAVIGILTGGGAIALYNLIKPLWEKK